MYVAKVQKRKRMENFEIQSLREIVKTGRPDVVKNIEDKFKEIRVKGKTKTFKDSVTNYTESPPKTYYTEAEQTKIEAMYMGKESLSRKRFSNSRDRVLHLRMEDKDHCLRIEMIGKGTFPSLGIIILGMTGIEEDLLAGDKNCNTMI